MAEGIRQEQEEQGRSLRHISRQLDDALKLLNNIWAAGHVPKHPATALKLLFGLTGNTMATAVLHLTSTSVTGTLVATDAKGNVFPLPNPPVWSLSAAGIVVMTVAADGMSAAFAPVSPGSVIVDVVAEGDPTPGVDTVHGTGDITVLAAEAASIALTFGPVT